MNITQYEAYEHKDIGIIGTAPPFLPHPHYAGKRSPFSRVCSWVGIPTIAAPAMIAVL